MKIDKSKDPVRLRTHELVGGGASLYLDIYVNGKRQRENLKLYLLPETEKGAKSKNKNTLLLANTIKAERLLEIQNNRFSFEKKKNCKTLLLDFLVELYEEAKIKKSDNYSYTCRSVIMHMKNYIGKKIVFVNEVDRKFVEGFIKYLSKTKSKSGTNLGKETIYTYYMNVCIALNKAVKRELIEKNPCDLIPSEDKPKRGVSNRAYLTLDEIKKMAETECKDIRVKRMFMFACFTGLRYMDIYHLRWKNLKEIEEGVYQLELIQKKTKQPITIPLSENALCWLPNRGMEGEENRIFYMPETSVSYDYLHKWAEKAGINKHVTFHVGRHTYATLLLYYGVDLFTVSKLLGHTNVKTTQIYAKVMDDTKRKAVSAIPQI